ncbi:MAG: outer membrane beta-barrel family protein [Crocinitomicaceae bacterium]|nr:TonB-dependent receptor [Crocinitomicaceae bacterium]
MLFRISTLALFIFICFSGNAQTYKVKGLLSSQEEAVPFATVFVKNSADSTVAKVGFSDTLGIFDISGVSNGTYFLEVKMVGLKNYLSDAFTIKDANKDMGEIEMKGDAELEAIEVVKIRPIIEVHPDKMVFNVDNTINATGENGFDLLRKAPGVIIDNQNNIMLEGKAGVQVYIDHKPTLLAGDDLVNFLKSMNATEIDKIEIITQPSSKYDAAGNAGIINIILKKDKNLGTNGTINAGYNYGIGFEGEGLNHRFNGSISLNNRTRKTNLYGSYNNGLGAQRVFLLFDRLQNGNQYVSESYITSPNKNHMARVGLDWFLNDKHTLGFITSGNYFIANASSESFTHIGLANQPFEQVLTADNITEGRNIQATGNINYRFADTLGKELIMDLDYAWFDRTSDAFQPNVYTDTMNNILFENNYRIVSPTEIGIASIKMDYSQYAWKGKLGFGAKFSMVSTKNDFRFYTVTNNVDSLVSSRSNDFNYLENIGAAYVNYGRQFGMKWNMQLGLRYEHNISKGDLYTDQGTYLDTVNRNNPQLFPSAGLTWTPSMKSIWSWTYSRRITRPNYQTLNPFISQLDELSYRQGNPTLKPQYAHNVRLSYTRNYRYTAALSYSYVQNYYAQVTDTLGFAQNFIQTRNVADEQTINLTVSLPFQVKKWWSLFINLQGYNTSYIQKDEKFKPINRTTGNIYASNTFLVKGGFKFEVSGWVNSPSIWGGTYLVGWMGSLDLAMEKKFFKDQLSVRIFANDVLFTSYWTADLQYGDLYIKGSGGWESRKVGLNLSYNFGNKEMKKNKEHKSGLEDEEKRTGGGN